MHQKLTRKSRFTVCFSLLPLSGPASPAPAHKAGTVWQSHSPWVYTLEVQLCANCNPQSQIPRGAGSLSAGKRPQASSNTGQGLALGGPASLSVKQSWENGVCSYVPQNETPFHGLKTLYYINLMSLLISSFTHSL